MAAVEQVKANAAVLLAAQNAVNTDAATVTALLGQAGTRDKIIGHLTTDKEEGIALSEAALAYGMYVAYAHHTGNAVEADLEPLEIMTKLEEPGFKEYINGPQGQIDLQGYLSSMQMINSSTESKEAVEKLMVNGFADPDLKGIIEDAANE